MTGSKAATLSRNESEIYSSVRWCLSGVARSCHATDFTALRPAEPETVFPFALADLSLIDLSIQAYHQTQGFWWNMVSLTQGQLISLLFAANSCTGGISITQHTVDLHCLSFWLNSFLVYSLSEKKITIGIMYQVKFDFTASKVNLKVPEDAIERKFGVSQTQSIPVLASA